MSNISSNTTSTTNVTNKALYGPPSLVIGDIAIEKKAIEDDLRYLLQEFIKLKSLKFKDFVKLWEELDFTLIQFICTDKNYRSKYLSGLYEIPISYLIQFNNAYMDIGNLYILYMLYYTQPNAFPKVLIKVTQYVWIKLCNINEWAKKHNLYDTMYIFYKMKYDQIFEFVAFCKGQEGLKFSKKNSSISKELQDIQDHIEKFNFSNIMNDNELEDLNNTFNKYFEEKEILKKNNEIKNMERSVKLNLSNNLFEKNESSFLDDINENSLYNIAYYQHCYTLKLEKLDNSNYLEKLLEKHNRTSQSDEEVDEGGDEDDDIMQNLSQNDLEEENLEGLSVREKAEREWGKIARNNNHRHGRYHSLTNNRVSSYNTSNSSKRKKINSLTSNISYDFDKTQSTEGVSAPLIFPSSSLVSTLDYNISSPLDILNQPPKVSTPISTSTSVNNTPQLSQSIIGNSTTDLVTDTNTNSNIISEDISSSIQPLDLDLLSDYYNNDTLSKENTEVVQPVDPSLFSSILNPDINSFSNITSQDSSSSIIPVNVDTNINTDNIDKLPFDFSEINLFKTQEPESSDIATILNTPNVTTTGTDVTSTQSPIEPLLGLNKIHEILGMDFASPSPATTTTATTMTTTTETSISTIPSSSNNPSIIPLDNNIKSSSVSSKSNDNLMNPSNSEVYQETQSLFNSKRKFNQPDSIIIIDNKLSDNEPIQKKIKISSVGENTSDQIMSNISDILLLNNKNDKNNENENDNDNDNGNGNGNENENDNDNNNDNNDNDIDEQESITLELEKQIEQLERSENMDENNSEPLSNKESIDHNDQLSISESRIKDVKETNVSPTPLNSSMHSPSALPSLPSLDIDENESVIANIKKEILEFENTNSEISSLLRDNNIELDSLDVKEDNNTPSDKYTNNDVNKMESESSIEPLKQQKVEEPSDDNIDTLISNLQQEINETQEIADLIQSIEQDIPNEEDSLTKIIKKDKGKDKEEEVDDLLSSMKFEINENKISKGKEKEEEEKEKENDNDNKSDLDKELEELSTINFDDAEMLEKTIEFLEKDTN